MKLMRKKGKLKRWKILQNLIPFKPKENQNFLRKNRQSKSTSPKPGPSSQQYFEDISSDDESSDKNKPSSLVPSRSGSITPRLIQGDFSIQATY